LADFERVKREAREGLALGRSCRPISKLQQATHNNKASE
jgi:hypothetical protein